MEVHADNTYYTRFERAHAGWKRSSGKTFVVVVVCIREMTLQQCRIVLYISSIKHAYIIY